MAKVFLNSGESFTLANSAEVYGAAGTGTEKVLLTGAATAITTDQNIERVDLSGNLNAYTFQVVGNQVKVYAGTTLVTTIGVKGDTTGTKVAFGDGSTDLKITGLNQATLGGQALSSTAAAAVTGATLDATDKSATAGSTGTTTPGVGQAFTLTNTTTGKIASLTTGNDTVDASTNVDTLNSASITDTSMTDSDVVNSVITASATPSSIYNVENLNVDFKGFGLTLDATNVSYGLTAGTNLKLSTTQANNDAAIVSGLGSKNVNVELTSSIKNLTLTGTSSSTDATKLTLAGGALTLVNTTGTGIETVTLNSKGAANVVTLTGTGGTGISYVASGDQNLTVKGNAALFGATSGASTKFSKDASFTKTLILEDTTATGNIAFNNAVVDKIVLSAQATGTGTFGHNANVSLNTSGALSGATVDLQRLSSDTAATGTLTTLNLSIDKTDAISSNTITFAENVKTVNLTTNVDMVGSLSGAYATFNFKDTSTGADVKTLNLLGTKDVFLSGATSGVGGSGNDKIIINAGGLSGKLSVVATATVAASDKILVIGTEQNDTITALAANSGGDTLIGAGGNDTITSASGNDSVNGGAGNDTITLSKGTDTVTGGDGADIFILGSGATDSGTIKDFVVGTDVLVLTGTGTLLDVTKVVLNNGTLSGVTGFTGTTFENNGVQLANTTVGGDNWTASLQLGSSSTAYAIASGTSGITAGALNDNITVTVGSGNASGNRTISLGAGDDKIVLTGANGATGSVTISGGAGNDTIDLGASGSGSVGTVKFEATAAANGIDTINGFVSSGTTGTNVDKLDFSAFLGSTGLANYGGSTGTGSSGGFDFTATGFSGNATGNETFIVFGKTVLTTSDISTSATAGKITVENNSKSVVILGATNAATQASIYYVEDTDASAAVNYSVTLVGTLNFGTSGGSLVDIVHANNFV